MSVRKHKPVSTSKKSVTMYFRQGEGWGSTGLNNGTLRWGKGSTKGLTPRVMFRLEGVVQGIGYALQICALRAQRTRPSMSHCSVKMPATTVGPSLGSNRFANAPQTAPSNFQRRSAAVTSACGCYSKLTSSAFSCEHRSTPPQQATPSH